MAIVPLAKTTIYGPVGDKQETLQALQDLGCVHLVDLSGGQANERPAEVVSNETRQALKFLNSCPIRRRIMKDERNFDLEQTVQEAVRIESRQESLRNEHDELSSAIETLRPWGDFRLPDKEELGDLTFWFYPVPHYRMNALQSCDAPWQVVARDNRFAYVAVIASREPENMPAQRVRLDPRPHSELQARRDEIEAELEELHWQRVALTRWIDAIGRSIALADERAEREYAAGLSPDDPHVFVLQGWTPTRDLDRIRALARERSLALTVEPPSANDAPPTLLENPPAAAGGEGAVTFYITPAYDAWDPSAVVFVSFSVFFAMIMADAGYAVVLGGMLLLSWRKLGRSESSVRFRRLAAAIVTASVGYGVLIGSYFGVAPDPDSLLGRVHVIDAADTDLMMAISIALGVFHLALANAVVAWRSRRSLTALASLGWIAVLLGGMAVGFGSADGADPRLTDYGAAALVVGLTLVLFFSSDRPFLTTQWKTHLWRFLDGLLGLTKITRAFGDVLSYLRLFALGLASAQLAATFNGLMEDAGGYAGVGSLIAILVVIFGHGLNLTLAVMGGVVHGLRLNCIEFFGWGLTEEGYPFQPFRRKAT